MVVKDALEKAGLTPNEVKVYLAINDKGEMPAGKAAKTAEMDRSSCYNALKTLTYKGLVSYVVKGKTKWFQITSPRRLLEYVKEKEEAIEGVLPELERRHQATGAEGQVRLFKGVRGVKSVFMDIARTGEDNDAFGSEGQFSERMPEFASQFDRLKRENSIRTRLIIREDKRELDKGSTTYRYIPGLPASPAVTNIYGDKIAIMVWTDEPEAVVIENPAAAEAYRTVFEFMWRNAKPMPK